MHLLLVKYTLLMNVVKIVDCSIAGWSYMDPISQQNMSPYGPHRSRVCPSKALYWYPRPTSNLSYQLQNLQGRPQPLNPWPAPPPPLYSMPAQPKPSTPCPNLPPSIVCQIFALITPCPLSHYPATSQPNNSTSQEFNKMLSPTNSTTTFPLLSTSTTQRSLQQLSERKVTIISVPSNAHLPSYLPQPQISNIVPVVPQHFSQLMNLPNFLSPFPMTPSLSIPLVPQIGILPGLPELISSDGGISIMPFSDVYSDLYKKIKNKVARKELRKVRNFEDYKKIKDNAKLMEYTMETMEFVSQEQSEEE